MEGHREARDRPQVQRLQAAEQRLSCCRRQPHLEQDAGELLLRALAACGAAPIPAGAGHLVPENQLVINRGHLDHAAVAVKDEGVVHGGGTDQWPKALLPDRGEHGLQRGLLLLALLRAGVPRHCSGRIEGPCQQRGHVPVRKLCLEHVALRVLHGQGHLSEAVSHPAAVQELGARLVLGACLCREASAVAFCVLATLGAVEVQR
mmetsp:Transcript_49761/g.144399  ORF Transcript_49761/g.144399 Transcript_49761/m.144399 type:complete len:205 (-) Transcript_49761:702-1316(-)